MAGADEHPTRFTGEVESQGAAVEQRLEEGRFTKDLESHNLWTGEADGRQRERTAKADRQCFLDRTCS
jgi:hypothetical protein